MSQRSQYLSSVVATVRFSNSRVEISVKFDERKLLDPQLNSATRKLQIRDMATTLVKDLKGDEAKVRMELEARGFSLEKFDKR